MSIESEADVLPELSGGDVCDREPVTARQPMTYYDIVHALHALIPDSTPPSHAEQFGASLESSPRARRALDASHEGTEGTEITGDAA